MRIFFKLETDQKHKTISHNWLIEVVRKIVLHFLPQVNV